MKKIKMVIPKGRIFKKVAELLKDSGIEVKANDRVYIPHIGDPEIEAKIMKPQNIAQLVELGSHDVGFTGYDWVVETQSKVQEIMDLGLDRVKIVAAVPCFMKGKKLKDQKMVVASEYEHISRQFLNKYQYDYLLLRTHGATEAYPPQDATMIIDNISTGQTLKDHNLEIIHNLMDSSTRFIANPQAMEDEWKKKKIDELKMLFEAVLNARSRVMLEMNVPAHKLEEIVNILPCMRAPTVSTLYKGLGYAVKVAVKKEETVKLIPLLKRMGATDILETEFKKVIA
ncbi:ATP phosphoribosyltransferase [bacterium]|nr:ATP phosphoribosyltransferase [bacterium]